MARILTVDFLMTLNYTYYLTADSPSVTVSVKYTCGVALQMSMSSKAKICFVFFLIIIMVEICPKRISSLMGFCPDKRKKLHTKLDHIYSSHCTRIQGGKKKTAIIIPI